jgi:transposase-like protein
MSGKPGKPQPTYTPQFRADAVRLVAESGQSVRRVAADLGGRAVAGGLQTGAGRLTGAPCRG